MIILVEGLENTIWLKVNASIDISGFSCGLAACGTYKTIPDISKEGLKFVFSASEVSETTRKGIFGTLSIYDSDGKEYLKVMPLFRSVPKAEDYKAIGFDTIYMTVSNNDTGGTGGDTPTPPEPGDYVTHSELTAAMGTAKSEAITTANKYTDDSISGIETTIIEEQPVNVLDSEGNPTSMTVQAAVQSLVLLQAEMQEAMETHVTTSVKDEDGDGKPDGEVLYLNPVSFPN